MGRRLPCPKTWLRHSSEQTLRQISAYCDLLYGCAVPRAQGLGIRFSSAQSADIAATVVANSAIRPHSLAVRLFVRFRGSEASCSTLPPSAHTRCLERSASERSHEIGPLAPRRDALNHAVRTSAGRGDARGVGYRKTRSFFAMPCFSPPSRPHSPSSPRPVRICSVRPFDREHGARGPGTRRSFREPASSS
jgi:hypothetical protein